MRKWVLREKISENLEEQLLFCRGIKTKEEAENFFAPSYDRDLGDPFGFLNMERLLERVIRAIGENERIVVFGDYDADGICASVIFRDFFKKIGFDNFQVYIPDRYQGGYGLNQSVVDEFVAQKTALIVTVDCGITDIKEIEYAKKKGIDVIIIDHHLPFSELPPALAIVDPLQEKDSYPFKYLCGAGLVFKVASALVKNSSFKIIPGWEKWFLDIVAIATIADMVTLSGENRLLVFYGLEVLKKTRRKGLRRLFRKLQLELGAIAEDDIAFLIAPCINVASRMDHATLSYSLLISESDEEAEWLSQRLIEKNSERKRITDEAMRKIDSGLEIISSLPEVLVLGDETWPVGILGILANKVLEKYSRPVFLWGRGGITTEIKGSCRSDGSVNLVDLLKQVGDKVFLELGGHAVAAGFTVKEGAISILEKEINETYSKIPHQKVELPAIHLDAELNLENINIELIEILDKFRPFGAGNPRPIFLFPNLEIRGVKTFGNRGNHLQIDFKKSNGEIIPAIGFSMENNFEPQLKNGSRVDLAASVEKSLFKGYPELRLRIVDVRNSQ